MTNQIMETTVQINQPNESLTNGSVLDDNAATTHKMSVTSTNANYTNSNIPSNQDKNLSSNRNKETRLQGQEDTSTTIDSTDVIDR